MHLELDAAGTDVIAMNLTIATLERWLPTAAGQQGGTEIGATYREVHAVVDEMSPDGVDNEEDDEDEEEDEAIDAHAVAMR